MRTNRTVLALALAAGLLALGATAAQDKARDPRAEPKPAAKSDKAAAKEPAKKPGAVTAVVGADVYTVTRGVIRGGTVLVQDGKIIKVGQDVAVPDGATVIDAAGKIVTPGYVAVNATGVGIRAAGGIGAGGGGGPGARPDRTADNLNPYDRNLLFCLGAGITTACVDLGGGLAGRFGRSADDETSTCPCCGLPILPTEPITPPQPTERTPRRHAVLKMTYGELAPMLVKETPFYHLTAGALTGPLNRHRWRETIGKARQYLKDQAAHAASEDKAGGPPRVPVSEDVLKLVKKEVPLVVDASSAEQVREMVALAKELDYQLVVEDAHEAWLVAGELGSAKASVVLTPRSRRRPQPGKEDSSGSSIETSAALEKAGVPFAVAALGSSVSLDGIAGRDLTSLALEAAFAVRGGCSEQAALAALTIEPAKMLGLADRVGSVEEGKDADLLVLTGPPLDYRTYVDKALVGGKIYYDRGRDKIYPDAPGR
jgi:imidazolonepropionase-like amidohydrolase